RGFFVAADHVGGDTKDFRYAGTEHIPVRGITRSAGGHHAYLPDTACLVDLPCVLGEHRKRAVQRLAGEPSGAVDILAEANDLGPPRDLGETTITDIGDEQPDRVRAAIHGGHPGHHWATHEHVDGVHNDDSNS